MYECVLMRLEALVDQEPNWSVLSKSQASPKLLWWKSSMSNRTSWQLRISLSGIAPAHYKRRLKITGHVCSVLKCVFLFYKTHSTSRRRRLYTYRHFSFQTGQSSVGNSRRDTDTTPEGEAGPPQTCTKKQACRTECVPVRCRVGLWARIMRSYI